VGLVAIPQERPQIWSFCQVSWWIPPRREDDALIESYQEVSCVHIVPFIIFCHDNVAALGLFQSILKKNTNKDDSYH